MCKEIIAYKLVRQRADGTLGPLFINRQQVIPIGKWLKAEDHPTEGYAHRPGWHVTLNPVAPHLSLKGRTWVEVRVRSKGLQGLQRPKSQGGLWLLAKWMKVISLS
jgi:hypothetical protein